MDKQWTAKWVMDPRFYGFKPLSVHHKESASNLANEHKEELENVHMFIRKTFDLQEVVTESYMELTADDYYKLYVNGHFVGQGPAQGNYYHYFPKFGDNIFQ